LLFCALAARNDDEYHSHNLSRSLACAKCAPKGFFAGNPLYTLFKKGGGAGKGRCAPAPAVSSVAKCAKHGTQHTCVPARQFSGLSLPQMVLKNAYFPGGSSPGRIGPLFFDTRRPANNGPVRKQPRVGMTGPSPQTLTPTAEGVHGPHTQHEIFVVPPPCRAVCRGPGNHSREKPAPPCPPLPRSPIVRRWHCRVPSLSRPQLFRDDWPTPLFCRGETRVRQKSSSRFFCIF